jgi:hypothetical protein
MVEAIGRRVDDYLVKPASPRQVLSVVTRLLEGQQLQQQRAAQDFAARFGQLSRMRDEARPGSTSSRSTTSWWTGTCGCTRRASAGWPTRCSRCWRICAGLRPLRAYGSTALARGAAGRPPLSTDVVERWVVPQLKPGRPLLFVVIDCMRLDQWRALRPLLGRDFDIEESLYSSILPTATPYSRNAIFSGQFPDEIARRGRSGGPSTRAA